jgi:hypothetical protein
VLVERWRQTYNRIRPHSALGYRPPAPEPSCRNTPDSHCGWYNYRGQVKNLPLLLTAFVEAVPCTYYVQSISEARGQWR